MYALRQIANRIGGFVRVRPTLGRLVLKLIPDLEWTLSLAEIGPMKINIRRHRSYWLRHPLYDSAFTFGALARLVHEGDVVFDVGANIGLYARYMLEVFKAGRVVAFEPMSDNFRLLRENLECRADRALLFNLAVSDTDGREFLELDDVMSCTAVLDSVTGGQAC
jgi:predicted RNA methylase